MHPQPLIRGMGEDLGLTLREMFKRNSGTKCSGRREPPVNFVRQMLVTVGGYCLEEFWYN